MHQIVLGLERGGLIARSRHPEHGRIQQASLTELGQTRLEHARVLIDRIEQRMTRDLSEVDVRQVGSLLTVCYEALRNLGEVGIPCTNTTGWP